MAITITLSSAAMGEVSEADSAGPCRAQGLDRMAIMRSPGEEEIVYMAVIDVVAHDGRIVEVRGPAWPAPGGWTEQEITGSRGTILTMDPEREIVERQLDVWLRDCPATRGGRCATHAPEERS